MPQPVNAKIRHMHRENGAHSNLTCGLRAPFDWHTFDSWFYLCRAKEVNTHTPNQRSGDTPSVLTKQSTRTQCKSVS